MKQQHRNRRSFVKSGIITLGAGLCSISAFSRETKKPDQPQTKDPIKLDLVKEFVAKAHGDLKRVTELLDQEPSLLNSSWDWGGGDFETGIGGAGHMGRVDIAEFLLSKGARMDIFVAAMLGKLDVVKSTLTAYPNLKVSKGPHGLQLLHHARKGGEQSKAVLDYLTEIGAE